MINVLRDVMNQTSVLNFSNIYCKTSWPVQCPLMHCLSSVALCIWDLLWIFTEYLLQPYFWKGTWHPVPSLEFYEWAFYQWISLEMLQCCFSICQRLYKTYTKQTIKNSTLKQRAVSIWIGLRAWEITWAPEITMAICFRDFSWLLV